MLIRYIIPNTFVIDSETFLKEPEDSIIFCKCADGTGLIR